MFATTEALPASQDRHTAVGPPPLRTQLTPASPLLLVGYLSVKREVTSLSVKGREVIQRGEAVLSPVSSRLSTTRSVCRPELKRGSVDLQCGHGREGWCLGQQPGWRLESQPTAGSPINCSMQQRREASTGRCRLCNSLELQADKVGAVCEGLRRLQLDCLGAIPRSSRDGQGGRADGGQRRVGPASGGNRDAAGGEGAGGCAMNTPPYPMGKGATSEMQATGVLEQLPSSVPHRARRNTPASPNGNIRSGLAGQSEGHRGSAGVANGDHARRQQRLQGCRAEATDRAMRKEARPAC